MEKELKAEEDMVILESDVRLCNKCGNYTGWVIEKYNGGVEVMCVCDIDMYLKENRPLPDPGMICPNGGLWWRPISNHKNALGESWHRPYFMAIPMNHSPRKA